MGKTTITLASGKEMPLVGFGLWKVPIESTADTVFSVSDYFHGQLDVFFVPLLTPIIGNQRRIQTFRRCIRLPE